MAACHYNCVCTLQSAMAIILPGAALCRVHSWRSAFEGVWTPAERQRGAWEHASQVHVSLLCMQRGTLTDVELDLVQVLLAALLAGGGRADSGVQHDVEAGVLAAVAGDGGPLRIKRQAEGVVRLQASKQALMRMMRHPGTGMERPGQPAVATDNVQENKQMPHTRMWLRVQDDRQPPHSE